MLLGSVALMQFTVSAYLCQQQLRQCKGTFAPAEETSAALPLGPVVLSHSAELGAGLWKTYCYGEESEEFCNSHRSTVCSQIWVMTLFFPMYLLIDYSPVGMVSPEQAECWRLFPHGLQCDHAFHYAEGEFNITDHFVQTVQKNSQNTLHRKWKISCFIFTIS